MAYFYSDNIRDNIKDYFDDLDIDNKTYYFTMDMFDDFRKTKIILDYMSYAMKIRKNINMIYPEKKIKELFEELAKENEVSDNILKPTSTDDVLIIKNKSEFDMIIKEVVVYSYNIYYKMCNDYRGVINGNNKLYY